MKYIVMEMYIVVLKLHRNKTSTIEVVARVGTPAESTSAKLGRMRRKVDKLRAFYPTFLLNEIICTNLGL